MLIQDLPSVYFAEPDKAYEVAGEKIRVDDCHINGITITDEIEDHEDIITFYLTLNISYDFRDIYGGFGNMDLDCKAIVNYSLSADKFYYHGNEDPEGVFWEFEGLGEEI